MRWGREVWACQKLASLGLTRLDGESWVLGPYGKEIRGNLFWRNGSPPEPLPSFFGKPSGDNKDFIAITRIAHSPILRIRLILVEFGVNLPV